ncbi:hypothetical protein DPMN_061251 [Dreissena polymorpha]|uniref:Uncharacterized protein n=1 Tax=Dreissena polymorpha TaxID=45954 RepID=A0A9D4C797_DREPO|nr:hypothetical protein DPMN_061251 [Dreissena polymorpha]
MATPLRRSLPKVIGQGHRLMSDCMASALLCSLSGYNIGHDMTGTSSGTGPVRAPVTMDWSGHRSSITGDRSEPPGTGPVIGQLHRSTGTGHRSPWTGPVTPVTIDWSGYTGLR